MRFFFSFFHNIYTVYTPFSFTKKYIASPTRRTSWLFDNSRVHKSHLNKVNEKYYIVVTFYYFPITIYSLSSINHRCMRDLRRYRVTKSAFIRGSIYFSIDRKLCKTDAQVLGYMARYDCYSCCQRAHFLLANFS